MLHVLLNPPHGMLLLAGDRTQERFPFFVPAYRPLSQPGSHGHMDPTFLSYQGLKQV